MLGTQDRAFPHPTPSRMAGYRRRAHRPHTQTDSGPRAPPPSLGTMDTPADIWNWVHDERLGLAALLESLDEEQWRTPSLCQGWTVREVAGHLLTGPNVGMFKFMMMFARNRGDFDATMDRLAHQMATRPPTQIVADLRTIADDHWTPPGSGPEAPYTDLLVHGQDIRRPLGIQRDLPEEGLRLILTKSIQPRKRSVFPKGRFDNLRFEATDLDWTGGPGDGDLLRGPAESLMMAIWGRGPALGELTGPGVEVLANRLENEGR